MPTGRPVHAHRSFNLAEVLRVITATTIAGAGLGYLVADYDGDTLHSLARVAFTVGVVTAVLAIFEARRRQQLDGIAQLLDEKLERQRQWRAYADVLHDLGGIDGETSGDISTRRN